MLSKICAKLCRANCDKICPYSWTILRVVVGVIMTVHGWQKMQDVTAWAGNLAQMGIPLPELSAYLSIAGEFLGGLGLILGLFTPLAAFGVAATMAVAIYTVHLFDVNGSFKGLLAQNGGFEYPLTLFAVAVFFMANGGGPFSLDALLGKKLSCCQKDNAL